MKRNHLSSSYRRQLQLEEQQIFKPTGKPRWVSPALAVVLGIVLLSLAAPTCQGSSLLVRRDVSSRREPYQIVQQQRNWDTDAISLSSQVHSIQKRDVSPTTHATPTTASSAGNDSSSNSKVQSSAVYLNDSHNQLLVYWAGEDVILCLAKDANSNGSSTLYISRDYGGTFSNATVLLIPQNQTGGNGESHMPLPVLEGFFNHPLQNGHFAFTDILNKVIYTTRNYGTEFTRNKVDFAPDEILFDPHSDTNIVAYEKTTRDKQMWVSLDFGKTWSKVQEHVKNLEWDESVMPATLYLQREEPSSSGTNGTGDSRSVILKSSSLFLDPKDTEVVISGVDEFEIKDDFMFATKPKENGTFDLHIAYKKGSFKKAIFPSNQATKHFFVADVSPDGQIFVCVVQNASVTNLFIGSIPEEDENAKFTLSLERIFYFKPNVTWSDSWLNEVASEPFVDLHHVEGLRGVYLANQLKPSTVYNGRFNMNEVISLITYDQGGKWSVLKPPEFEHDGRPIYCQYSGGGNCSLHISQRLSELYPRTRAIPVLSKKSAVGLVMATGTVNTTLKGRLGVYLSTDGANSWRQILQGNYLYAFGDHGGIIVATKMYRIGDDTNELLYSVDEGETWEKYQFYKEKVRIMGLMTEPGENTTTFFIFGSVPPPKSDTASSNNNNKHTWVLIKLDFRNAFDRNCAAEDYKAWSPWDGEDGTMRRHCLLGRREFYDRRIPSHRCYNGQGFVRPVTNKSCMCDRIDFECDFGYVLEPHGKDPDQKCVRDNSENSQVKPEWCRPLEHGLPPAYYNKTRGYRKIPGDTCREDSNTVAQFLPEQIPCEVKEEPEFMLVAKRDSVLRIDLNHFERVETLPLTRVKSAIAVDFNLKNNCIFWSDVQHKSIMKLHLDGKSTAETLITSDITSVEGLAFDWMSNNLYFTDGGGAKIEVVRVDNHRMRKRLVMKPLVEKPRGIAVHPEKGFIFWTDWSTSNPCIGRAHLDGTNVTIIVKNKENPGGQPLSSSELTIKWPNGITIDFPRNRLFWVDAHLDQMLTSDLNGGNLQVVLGGNTKISHPFGVGVYKSSVYWDDWTTRGIYGVPLNLIQQGNNFTASSDSIFRIKGDLPRLMELKVYGTGMQQDKNLCSSQQTSGCDSLCFSTPNGNVSCQCPDGFIFQNSTCVCPDGKKPNTVNGTQVCHSKCDDGQSTFKCRSHSDFCIISAWRCDGENDCGDYSDEENCETQVCADPTEFKCKHSGRCIPSSFKCDYDHDCGSADTSDEEDCPANNQCDPVKNFQCDNGRCIIKTWRCDDDDDCLDGSDERNCTIENNNGTIVCSPNEWKCTSEEKCLSADWVCDIDQDCVGGEDEANCQGRLCPEWKFTCNSTGRCIMSSWECDGDKDCPDGSDEHANCSTTTLPIPDNPFVHGNCSQMSQMFQCLGSKECIPIYWKCDSVKDCRDESDELGCSEDPDGSSQGTVTVAPPPKKCPLDEFRCNDGACIASYSVCDGFPDCLSREDEEHCTNGTGGAAPCPIGMRKCGETRICIPQVKWCDKVKNCPNGADELDCKGTVPPLTCNSGEFMCDDLCQALYKRCNGNEDCFDGTDETPEVCTPSYKRVHQVDGLSFPDVESTWLEMDWWLPSSPSGKRLQFLPSLCEVESKDCPKANWTSKRQYRFDGLHAFKKYIATVYVRDPASNTTYPPFVYKNVTTGEDLSSAPWAVSVSQNTTEDLIIKWKRPHSPNGRLIGYKVYFQPPTPPASIDASEEVLVISNKQSDPVFLPGENYTFWVTAVNGRGEGKASEPISRIYNGEVAFISELNVKGVTENSVKFVWEPSNSHVDNYTIILQTDVPNSVYTFRNKTTTNKKTIDFSYLSAGTRYKLTVVPKYHGMHGSHRSISFDTKGDPLPKVEDLKAILAQNGNAKVSWRPVKITGRYVYGVYVGKTAQDIADRRAHTFTSETQVEISDLEACENYLFDIGLVSLGADGIGPLTEHPIQLVTKMNPQSSPKSVQIEHAPNGGEDGLARIKVSWKSPCGAMDQPVGYNITVFETTRNMSHGVSNVSFSERTDLTHFLNIMYGGHYQLTITTSVEGGKPSVPVYFDGPPIPFPDKVQQCFNCDHVIIFWTAPTIPKLVTQKGAITYVVRLSDNKDFANATTYETPNNSFEFDDIRDNGIYYAAVSVKDAEGLESPMSTPIVIQHMDGASSPIVVLPGSSALAITITVLVVIVLLVAVLAIFVVRHKRLQTSFLNFASSHYSSSSGAATFQQTMEDQDSPVIRGFSDDEPLLVA